MSLSAWRTSYILLTCAIFARQNSRIGQNVHLFCVRDDTVTCNYGAQVYRSRSDGLDHVVVAAPYRSETVISQSTLSLRLCLLHASLCVGRVITFRVSRRRREMYNIVVTRVCVSVCLSVCLSAAACTHYCTDPDVTWGSCPAHVVQWSNHWAPCAVERDVRSGRGSIRASAGARPPTKKN